MQFAGAGPFTTVRKFVATEAGAGVAHLGDLEDGARKLTVAGGPGLFQVLQDALLGLER
jgi:hypothetical protein